MNTAQSIEVGRTHLTRLMKIWRSAGWPCRDPVELDLLAAGLIALNADGNGRETLRLTDTGFGLLTASRQRNRRAMSRHERLAQRVARQLMTAGRVVWLELALRALVKAETPPASALTACEAMPDLDLWAALGADTPAAEAAESPKGVWRMARPDVFSVRNTSVEAYLQPVVHEIKVSRADLLSDLRNAAKREAYQWLCSACYYVFPAGIAKPNEIPEAFGVWVVHGDIDTGPLEQLRPARHAACNLPFPVWMALAKATPLRQDDMDEAQSHLGQPLSHTSNQSSDQPSDQSPGEASGQTPVGMAQPDRGH